MPAAERVCRAQTGTSFGHRRTTGYNPTPMSAARIPVNSPLGLVVGNAACRAAAVAALGRRGFCCDQTNDPYQAMLRLCKPGPDFACVVLSLNGLYREELAMIAAIKRHLPHLEIWLSNTDGRQASLAEAIRLGADGLLADDDLHRLGSNAAVAAPAANPAAIAPNKPGASTSIPPAAPAAAAAIANEPILSDEELRALLEDLPPAPMAGRMR